MYHNEILEKLCMVCKVAGARAAVTALAPAPNKYNIT
jgi:hypothetical protein